MRFPSTGHAPMPLPPFVQLVDCRSADDGQREQGFGALPGVYAMLGSGHCHLGGAAQRHRVGRPRVIKNLLNEIRPLAALLGDVLGFLIEFVAEFLAAASRGVIST
jgi:hypothetical protein